MVPKVSVLVYLLQDDLLQESQIKSLFYMAYMCITYNLVFEKCLLFSTVDHIFVNLNYATKH